MPSASDPARRAAGPSPTARPATGATGPTGAGPPGPPPERQSRPRARLGLIAGLVVVALASGACGRDGTVAPTSGPSTTGPGDSGATPVPPTTATPSRQRLDWVVELLNDPDLTAAEVATGFSPDFLAVVSAEEVMVAVGSVVGDAREWRVEEAGGLGPLEGEAFLISGQGTRVQVSIGVEAGEPHLIIGLLIAPRAFAPGQEVTFEDIDAQLSRAGEVAVYGLFDVSDGRCQLVHGLQPDRAVPLGSAFKLWVLGALALEVEASRAAWDEVLPVDDRLKSSPDGEIWPLVGGTPVTLERYAELMISISDNSATDHLLARLGRATVERAMTAAGVTDPSVNVPMLSTRELFLLKWGGPDRAGDYLALGPEDRRAYLDGELAGVPLEAEISADFAPPGPTLVDQLEWFASPADLCRTQVWLADMAARPGLAPTARILRLNPGVAFDPQWTDVRFKGGSEPGVVYASWRLAHRDGSVYVLTGGLSDTTRTVAEVSALTTLQAAAGLVP